MTCLFPTMPLSLQMLKRKKQQQLVVWQTRWDERLLDSAGDSMGRTFLSMVLIVQELQSFALQQMREAMLGDNQQGVLARVHGEMHASFVWLFQDIFAGTLALMVSPMLLLANFIVHSMGQCRRRSSHPSRSAFHRGCRGGRHPTHRPIPVG
uniref:Uncharacterized protein n=1 Tax=Oryza rufipogon TaxID=4529 RepID=A0A0E0QIE1_ORYRU